MELDGRSVKIMDSTHQRLQSELPCRRSGHLVEGNVLQVLLVSRKSRNSERKMGQEETMSKRSKFPYLASYISPHQVRKNS